MGKMPGISETRSGLQIQTHAKHLLFPPWHLPSPSLSSSATSASTDTAASIARPSSSSSTISSDASTMSPHRGVTREAALSEKAESRGKGESEGQGGWRAVDDRVRGGSSISHLEAYTLQHVFFDSFNSISPRPSWDTEKGAVGGEGSRGSEDGEEVVGAVKGKGVEAARFWGHLDTSTLGGAGFASQSFLYKPESKPMFSPEQFEGLEITYLPIDRENAISATARTVPAGSTASSFSDKATTPNPTEFTLVLKTSYPSNRPDGRRESTVTYEKTFDASISNYRDDPNPPGSAPQLKSLAIPWTSFTPTYRGRPLPRTDPLYKPLDPNQGLTEISIMCRSLFDRQKGDFELIVASIAAIRRQHSPKHALGVYANILRWFRYFTQVVGTVVMGIRAIIGI